jgi:hypothetical protein
LAREILGSTPSSRTIFLAPVAKWSGTALQKRQRGFDSRPVLCVQSASFANGLPWARVGSRPREQRAPLLRREVLLDRHPARRCFGVEHEQFGVGVLHGVDDNTTRVSLLKLHWKGHPISKRAVGGSSPLRSTRCGRSPRSRSSVDQSTAFLKRVSQVRALPGSRSCTPSSERAESLVVLVGVVEDRAVADRIALLRVVARHAVTTADALR